METQDIIVKALENIGKEHRQNHKEVIEAIHAVEIKSNEKHAKLDKRITTSETKMKVFGTIAMGIVTFIPKLIGLMDK